MRKGVYRQRLEQALQLPPDRRGTVLRRLIGELSAEKDMLHAHDASFHLAAFLYECDRIPQAKKILIPIVTNYVKYPFTPRYANMMMLLGIIELGEEDYTLANYYFESGLKLAKRHRIPRVVFLAYSNLAIVHSALNCHDTALKCLLMAKKHIDQQDEDGHALLYLNLAVCYKTLNRLSESMACITQCIEEYHGLEGQRRALIQSCQMDLFYRLGDQAHYEALKQCIISEGENDPTPDRLQAYQMICSNAFDSGDIALAEQMLARLKRCVQGRDDLATQVFIERLSGKMAYHQGDLQLYNASLEKQLALNKRISDSNSQRLIKSTGVEIRLAQLMRQNENVLREQEKERRHQQELSEALTMARNANRAKSEFLARMSHDIRTPMNAIVGYLGIAKAVEDCPDSVRHCIDNSEVAAKHLLQLINDVLDMSSIESGKMKIASEAFNVKQDIMDATTIFYQNSKAKGVQFETHIVGLRQEWLMGDSLRLNQIVMNLLSNAVKFTPEGGRVCLTVQQEILAEDGCDITISVQDTGIGMSKEYLSHLFQPFEQESAATARRYGGSGLGLSIVHRLVTLMGGTITVASRQGEGTTFTVKLHADSADGHAPVTLALPREADPRVLLLTTNTEGAEGIKANLADLGVEADIITSGSYGVKRLRRRFNSEHPYTLCLMDWLHMDGDSAAIAASLKTTAAGRAFSLAAMGYDVAAFGPEARASGVDSIVAMPLFPSDLAALLSTAGASECSVAHKETAAEADLHGKRAILAEDNDMNMEIAVTVLGRRGLVIDQAADGLQAVQLFASAPAGTYDFILMDVQMPVMDGYEATEAIRSSSHADAQTIPIIAMTANAFAEDVQAARDHGMTAHIAKPVNYAKLFSILAKK